MSAPNGFNPNDSMLPDPGPSAVPIHVMRGGNMDINTQSEENQKILREYGLHREGPLNEEISDEVKRQFLQQLKNSNCAVGTGDNIILNNECSAVVKVIRAMIQHNIKKTNGQPLPKSITTEDDKENKNDAELENYKKDNIENDGAHDSPEIVSNISDENMINHYTEIEENPSDYHGNDSGKYGHIDFNLTQSKITGPYFTNFKVDNKPIRVYGVTPDFVVRRSRKLKRNKSSLNKSVSKNGNSAKNTKNNKNYKALFNRLNKTHKKSNNSQQNKNYKKLFNRLEGKTFKKSNNSKQNKNYNKSPNNSQQNKNKSPNNVQNIPNNSKVQNSKGQLNTLQNNSKTQRINKMPNGNSNINIKNNRFNKTRKNKLKQD